MNKEAILADLDRSTENLFAVISRFPPGHFRHKPSENEWSAAQIAEHLLKVDLSTYKALCGETIPTNRPPDQKISLLKLAMEDSTKRAAPPTVIPSSAAFVQEVILQHLKAQREKLRETVRVSDLTEACITFKHPFLGTMTKLEWVYFTIYHAERHVRQMNAMVENSIA